MCYSVGYEWFICTELSISKIRFSEVFFISAETIEAELRNISIAKGAGDSASGIIHWLIRKNGEWLLLFESADGMSINLRISLIHHHQEPKYQNSRSRFVSRSQCENEQLDT
jgi:hypothetical protein